MHLFEESKRLRGGAPIVSVDKVVNFLFTVLFCPAVENPEIFAIVPEAPKKKAKKSLQVIGELLRSIGSHSEENIKDPRLLQFVKKRFEITRQLVEDWLVIFISCK